VQELLLVSVSDRVGALGRFIAQIKRGFDKGPSPISLTAETAIEYGSPAVTDE
jgi:hypothetical protein